MDELSLGVPEPIVELLPADSDDVTKDMHRAVKGWESHLNAALESADDDEAVADIVDALERMEARMETYDDFVPELRAWGQSPIYAIAWRDLYADLIGQVYEHEELAESLEAERNYRLVEDGIQRP